MAAKWKAPKGYTLTVIPAHGLDDQGFNSSGGDPRRARGIMPDGQIEVAWFDEDEPFIYEEHDGTGLYASQEAKDAHAAGKPLGGWNPNVTMKPIEGGYVPPQYVLRSDKDDTPETLPARAGDNQEMAS